MPKKPVENFDLKLTLQFPDAQLKKQITRKRLQQVVQAALFESAEITLRFVDAEEARVLNREYRGKDYATNVLTFAYSEDAHADIIQADIVLCADVLQREALEQNKSLLDHTIHLIVHGVLHAQGYDHEDAAEAAEMESLEIEILAGLGVGNPY